MAESQSSRAKAPSAKPSTGRSKLSSCRKKCNLSISPLDTPFYSSAMTGLRAHVSSPRTGHGRPHGLLAGLAPLPRLWPAQVAELALNAVAASLEDMRARLAEAKMVVSGANRRALRRAQHRLRLLVLRGRGRRDRESRPRGRRAWNRREDLAPNVGGAAVRGSLIRPNLWASDNLRTVQRVAGGIADGPFLQRETRRRAMKWETHRKVHPRRSALHSARPPQSGRRRWQSGCAVGSRLSVCCFWQGFVWQWEPMEPARRVSRLSRPKTSRRIKPRGGDEPHGAGPTLRVRGQQHAQARLVGAQARCRIAPRLSGQPLAATCEGGLMEGVPGCRHADAKTRRKNLETGWSTTPATQRGTKMA